MKWAMTWEVFGGKVKLYQISVSFRLQCTPHDNGSKRKGTRKKWVNEIKTIADFIMLCDTLKKTC